MVTLLWSIYGILVPRPFSALSNEKSKALVRDKPEDPDSRSLDMHMLNIF